MPSNTLLNEFNARKREVKTTEEVSDYLVFPDNY